MIERMATTGAPPFRCPSCDSQSWRSERTIREFALYRCGKCSLVTWDFTDRDMLELYREGYFSSPDTSVGYGDYLSLEETIRENAKKRIERLHRFDPSLPRAATTRAGRIEGGVHEAPRTMAAPLLVEVGCAHGFFLDEARRSGYRVAGVEPAVDASAHAREALSLDVATGTLADLDVAAGTANVVVLWDVIEHVDAPGQVLDDCVELLAPGGVLALSTGNVDSVASKVQGKSWHLYNLPEHLFFFTPRVLADMFERRGILDVESRHPSSVYPVRYLEERLGRTAWPRWLWSRLRLPGPVRSLRLPVNLWDVTEVIGRRATDSGSSEGTE